MAFNQITWFCLISIFIYASCYVDKLPGTNESESEDEKYKTVSSRNANPNVQKEYLLRNNLLGNRQESRGNESVSEDTTINYSAVQQNIGKLRASQEGTGSLLKGSTRPKDEEVLLQVATKPFTPGRNVTSLCRNHSNLYLKKLKSYTPWAVQMYDSGTKIPSGLTVGNAFQMGNYDECVKIKVWDADKTNTKKNILFRGQQCIADIHFNHKNITGRNATGFLNKVLDLAKYWYLETWKGDVPYQWSVCVPSSCTSEDVELSLNDMLEKFNNQSDVEISVEIDSDNCLLMNDSRKDYRPLDYGFIAVVVLFIIAIFGSTIYDYNRQWNYGPDAPKMTRLQTVYSAFSLYSNGKILLSTGRTGETMGCLNGLRFLSICWVIYGHIYCIYWEGLIPLDDTTQIRMIRRDWTRMWLLNFTLATDTFFLLGGILLCYGFMRERQRNPNFNLLKFYLTRYIRLTPAYAMVIWFYVTLFYRLGSGPQWESNVGVEAKYCSINWWANLIYINNYWDMSRMCMDHTWYLAADMQLYWLSPIILYPLWKWPKFGKIVTCVALAATCLSQGISTYLKEAPGIMIFTTNQEMVDFVYKEIYTRVYNKGGSYIVGLALGYLLFLNKKEKILVSKKTVAIGWLAAIFVNLIVVFGVYGIYQPDHALNTAESSVYAALHRAAYAISLAWLVFACVNGHAGPINTILAWDLFTPLSKLVYCGYLNHYIVLLYTMGTLKSPLHFSTYSLVLQFCGCMVLIILLSTLISLTLEMPFIVLNKALLSWNPSGKAAQRPTNIVIKTDDFGMTSQLSVPSPDTHSGNYNHFFDKKIEDEDEKSDQTAPEGEIQEEADRSAGGDNERRRSSEKNAYVNEGFEPIKQH